MYFLVQSSPVGSDLSESLAPSGYDPRVFYLYAYEPVYELGVTEEER